MPDASQRSEMNKFLKTAIEDEHNFISFQVFDIVQPVRTVKIKRREAGRFIN